MIFTSTFWLKHTTLLYSHLQGPFSWSFIFPLMHHYPSINALPSLPVLALLPVFPHTWPWEKFAERSCSEPPTGEKLRPLFTKKNFHSFVKTGLPYFSCTLAPISFLTSYPFFNSAPLHNCPSSTRSPPHLFTCIYSFLYHSLFELFQGNDPILLQAGIMTAIMGLGGCWLSANMVINQSSHHRRQELWQRTLAKLRRNTKNHNKVKGGNVQGGNKDN